MNLEVYSTFEIEKSVDGKNLRNRLEPKGTLLAALRKIGKD